VTATVGQYRPPFISQKRKAEPPYDDCALESGLMLLGSWTLGEGLRRPDGELRPLHDMSETLRKRIGEKSGGLTLADVDDALHTIDPDLPPLPRYPGQNPAPVPRATLRLEWAEYRRLLTDNHASILLGYQPGASIGHAIFVHRGDDKGAMVLDPWGRNGLSWEGERWTWTRLREYTERKVNGNRYGSPEAIACAAVPIGDESEAARVKRANVKAVETLTGKLTAQKAQTALATEERDDARRQRDAGALALSEAIAARDLHQANAIRAGQERDSARTDLGLAQEAAKALFARITDLELIVFDQKTTIGELTDMLAERPDCDELRNEHAATVSQLTAERDGALARAQQEQERANVAEDRASDAEAVIEAVRRAVAA
jgi:uncharacterized coiled-coil protein SlyX